MPDAVTIANTGVDPVSGSYLSPERRRAIFARTRISSNVFGRGGALVAINRQSDSGALVTTAIQNQTQNISSLQGQIDSLRAEVNDFRTALSRITDLIAYDSVLDQNRIRQEQEEQRRGTEQGLRIGRESLIERKIQNALLAPAQAIAQRTQSILEKVKQFFTTLFIGWFANQGIETLKALSDGNGRKLEEIRDNVLNGLGIAAGTLLLLSGGFFAIAGTITRLSLKIGGWLFKNTIGRFFGALGNLLKSAGSAIVSGAQAGVRVLTGVGPKAVPAAATAATAAARGGTGAALKGGGKLLGRIAPVAQTALGVSFGVYNLSQGRPISAAFDFGSAIPGPIGWAFLAGGLGYNLLGSPGEGKSNAKPQAPKKDKSKQLDASKPAEFGEVDITADVSSQAQTTRIPSATFNLGPTPEPTPNVVYKRIGSSAQQQSGAAPTGGSVNEVPAISASNPDNFYVLYSQVNYNVVT
jgi:hypothetical protein